ncbi:PTS N-acetylgalactosamine transporter subunit IIA [Salmonella enterica]|nr:PTS N-acetylgalactosamine transporter subunit IIA [Salmonella enterica]EDE6508949.1 PTS N-acetylgalactosamine transporter subunit IIA [Salmonella enterica subsp. enterica serovar Enteritidis]EDF0770847.1 PTS N-acetylgalactosamine transporter subunit IIA [Salmonella enterica subsp. enterica serovar Enteritidis]ELG2268046.1 PTS N-acetylgalactosamine transporter subunit IIA [Salmonella enterica]
MKIATVIASNGFISKELLLVAEDTVGHACNVSAIDFHRGESLDVLFKRYENALLRLDVRNGVLFLIEGKNSCHQYVASQFAYGHHNRQIVTGVNLQMLVSLLLSDSDETDPQFLALKAQQYGKDAINIIRVNECQRENELMCNTM